MSDFRHSHLGQVDDEVRVLWCLVNVIDASEALDLASASLGVDSPPVRLFAVLERSGDVDQEEVAAGSTASLGDSLASGSAAALVRRDGSRNHTSAGAGKLGRDECDALDVPVAVLGGEAEFGRKLRADGFTEKERDGAATLFVELDLEGARNLVLARVVQAGEEKSETLLVLGGVALAEGLDDALVREPVGDRSTVLETTTELSTADVHGLGARLDLVHGLVLVGRRKIGHLLERNHLDTKLLGVLGDKSLGVVRAVEVLAVTVLAGTSVVTTDNEVGNTEVLPDDRVPESLTRTTHAHGEREQGKVGHAVGVAGHQAAVDTHASVVVDITGLGHADNGVDEDVGLTLASGADSELTVSAVHGVTGLESDDLAPCNLREVLAELSGRVAEGNVVVVLGLGDRLDVTADVELLHAGLQVSNGRMGSVLGSEDGASLGSLLDRVYIGDCARGRMERRKQRQAMKFKA